MTNKYELPVFDKDKLFNKIDLLVKKAPGGIVQLVVDLFCGAGGTSEGIEQAVWGKIKNSVIVAGINHDIKAIYSQAMNHPLAYYTSEDIRFANMKPLKALIKELRKRYPQCPIYMWASLECTNHSNAKGGLARDPDSRTLPWELYRYITALNPDGIWIENVKEFSEWGPMMEKIVLQKPGKKGVTLKNPVPQQYEDEFYAKKIAEGYHAYCTIDKNYEDENGVRALKPEWLVIRDKKGLYFWEWLAKMDTYGYHHQHRVINAADHGTPQNRKRLFIIFARKGWPIVFPHPTHAKSPKKGDMFDPGLLPHVPVKECLDFTVEGRSIFEPGHIESDNTWWRVYEGLIKFVAGGKRSFMSQMNGNNPISRVWTTDEPARTVTTTGGKQEVVQTCFLDVVYGNGTPSSVNTAAPTVRTKDGLYPVTVQFLLNYQGQSNANSIEETCPTLMTKEKLATMNVEYFLYRAYSGGSKSGSIEKPEIAQTCVPKTALMKVEGWVMNTNYTNIGTALDDAANTVTSNRKWSYLMNPSWFGSTSGTDIPAMTVVARQDKAPIYLLSVKETQNALAIPVFKSDSEIVVKIKEFMALYSIYDIKKRMLLIPELLKIQSFPDNYILVGSKTDQKKFIGNAVPPNIAKAITESMYMPTVHHIAKIKKINLKIL